jgi:large subunit ribosomal protein L24
LHQRYYKEVTPVKIKKGDKVQIIAGKDKGKSGKVLVADAKNNKVIVEGCNMIKKHVKPNAMSGQGGIVSKEAPIDVSNVMYLSGDKVSRIGYKVVDGVKHRVAKVNGETID